MSAKVSIEGNVTRDPELKFTQQGKAIAKFGVVTSRRVKDQNSGEWSDADTSFWDVSAFGEMAENICESVSKGTRVIVTGIMRQESWEKEGEKKYAWKVIADDVAVSCKFAKVEATRNPSRSQSQASRPAYDEEPQESRRPWGTSRSDEMEPPF